MSRQVAKWVLIIVVLGVLYVGIEVLLMYNHTPTVYSTIKHLQAHAPAIEAYGE